VQATSQALAHEARLMILCLLVDGEKSVTEIDRRSACAAGGVAAVGAPGRELRKRAAMERASITRGADRSAQ
jgi:hypothetical protein